MLVRLLPLVLVLALAGLTTSACGGDDQPEVTTPIGTVTQETTATVDTTTAVDTTPAAAQPTTVTIVVENGAPKGGIKRATVKKGDRVVLVVRSDVADEIHLHGYDRSAEIEDGTARIAFTATTPGRFEIELERLGVPIGELTVSP